MCIFFINSFIIYKKETKVIYLDRFQVSDYKNANLSGCEDFDGFEIDFR